MGLWEDFLAYTSRFFSGQLGPNPITGPEGGKVTDIIEDYVDGVREVVTNVGVKTAEELMAMKIRMSFVEAIALLRWLKVASNQNEVRGMRAALHDAMLGFHFDDFKELWSTARQFVGLQSRLALEQIFWIMGPPWRELVTGFKAISFDQKGEDEKDVKRVLTAAEAAARAARRGRPAGVIEE